MPVVGQATKLLLRWAVEEHADTGLAPQAWRQDTQPPRDAALAGSQWPSFAIRTPPSPAALGRGSCCCGTRRACRERCTGRATTRRWRHSTAALRARTAPCSWMSRRSAASALSPRKGWTTSATREGAQASATEHCQRLSRLCRRGCTPTISMPQDWAGNGVRAPDSWSVGWGYESSVDHSFVLEIGFSLSN